MKILYIETKKKRNNYCNYYNDIPYYLGKQKELTSFQEILVNYRKQKIEKLSDIEEIKEIIQKEKTVKTVIILGFTFFNNDLPLLENDLENKNENIKLVVILNKEYKSLNKKLEWIKHLKPKLVLSVLNLKKYEKEINIPIKRIMWSANEKKFKNYGGKYNWDVFFSGVIREEQTLDWRNQIYKNILILNRNVSSIKFNIQARFKEKNYKGKIYSTEEYANNLSKSKICITTTGPADIVGTRYFEIMATNRALIFCNRIPNKEIYEDMFIENYNCVMFSTIKEFNSKLIFYLNNENHRMRIVNQAYEDFKNKFNYYKQSEKIINLLKDI